MSGFDARWRTLTKSARRAPEAPWGTPPLGLTREAREPVGATRTEVWWHWVGPVAAMVILYALALPLVDGALTATASLRVSFRDVPRPPALPPPPMPHAPLLPKPPSLPRTIEALQLFLVEPCATALGSTKLFAAPCERRLEFLAPKEARP